MCNHSPAYLDVALVAAAKEDPSRIGPEHRARLRRLPNTLRQQLPTTVPARLVTRKPLGRRARARLAVRRMGQLTARAGRAVLRAIGTCARIVWSYRIARATIGFVATSMIAGPLTFAIAYNMTGFDDPIAFWTWLFQTATGWMPVF